MQVVLGAPGHNCSNKSIFRRGKWTQAWTQSILCYCVISFHTLYFAAIIGKHPYTVTLRTCECVTSAASISQVPTSHLPVQASKTSLSFKVSFSVLVSAQKTDALEGWRCWQVLRLLWDVCVGVLVFRTWKPYLNFFADKLCRWTDNVWWVLL